MDAIGEDKRLDYLHDMNILDTLPEERFDDITTLVSTLFRVRPSQLFSGHGLQQTHMHAFIGADCIGVARGQGQAMVQVGGGPAWQVNRSQSVFLRLDTAP